MASQARTSAGTRIFISPALISAANYTAAAFAALPWKEIGEVSDLGEFGREYNVVNFNPLADRRTVKRKGSFNDGTVAMQLAKVSADEGQQVCKLALDSDSSYPIKIVLQDGSTFYFTAQVTSFTTNVGSIDQITAASINLEIDDDILEAAAVVVTATATATVSKGAVTAITVTNGGSGYSTTPNVVISGAGTGALASATIVSGVVTAVTIINGGSGYTSAPTVAFTV